MLSDEIIKDKRCLAYAKLVGGQHYLDMYNDLWLKIREKELRGYEYRIKNVYSFFRVCYYHLMIDYRFRIKCESLEGREMVDTSTTLEKFENWIADKNVNEVEQFYKNIIELVSKTDTISEAIDYTTMGRTVFYKHLNKAKQYLKDECT